MFFLQRWSYSMGGR